MLLVATASIAAAAHRARRPRPTVRLRRFVLLAGVDDGGPTRDAAALRGQRRARDGPRAADAGRRRARGHRVRRRPPTAPRSTPAFADIEQRLRAGATPGVRRELLVYYSGHSDEDGLLVGRDRVGYDELRARVQRAPADLRVVILDSCASGAFTRRKGGVKRAPFLMDASIDMRGHAFLTSSAADERAQESDRIAASYFTYYLVSGLRGAADVNQDRRVTLQEAYQFASQETLARTERSQAGPQHAAYEFDLAGTGDMVVTDVRGDAVGPGADARARRPHHRARGERRAGRRAAQAARATRSSWASSRAPTSSRWTAATHDLPGERRADRRQAHAAGRGGLPRRPARARRPSRAATTRRHGAPASRRRPAATATAARRRPASSRRRSS